MFNKEIKEIICIILFTLTNISIAYFITAMLGIQNVILFHTYTAMSYDVTYEVLLFMLFSLIESIFIHFKYEVE